MGNRAVITWSKAEDVSKSREIGIYLHWNGGMDSVRAFLKYCELKGYRKPDQDDYGYARLCQVIGNYFGGTASVGIDMCCCLDCDNGDNGVYICEGWDVVSRQFHRGGEQNEYDFEDMLNSINLSMPEKERLPAELIRSATLGKVPTADLRIGETIFARDYDGSYYKTKIVGIGDDEILNGRNVKGIPYIDKYGHGKDNINNYILEDYAYSAE